MSLLERTAPDRSTRSTGVPPYLVALGYGVVGLVALALVLFVPVLLAWTLDPRTTVAWSDALAFTSSLTGLALRGSVSVSSSGIDAVHFSPILLTGLAVVVTRWAYRPVQQRLDDDELPGELQQKAALVFVGGHLVATLLVCAASLGGSAPVRLWTVVPGSLLVSVAGLLWARYRDGEGESWPWLTAADERVHRSVHRALRPAAEGLIVLLSVGAVVIFGTLMFHLERMGKVAALLDVSGSGTALLWLGQLTALPNVIVSGSAWTGGGAVSLGSGQVTLGTVTPATLPSIPLFGILPEAGPLPGWLRLMVLLPVLIGGLIGWRVVSSMATLSHLGSKVRTAATAVGLFTVAFAVLVWLSRAGMSPGKLGVVGPSVLSIVFVGVEALVGALIVALGMHFRLTRR
ncbi:cell division protein PerM [Calidifontibacter terrae]